MFYENAFYVLLPVLIVITAVAFIMSEYDIMHPFTVVTAVATISTSVAMLGILLWNFYMGINAALLITTSVLVFGIASIWTDAVTKNRAVVQSGRKLCINEYAINNKHLCFFVLIILAVTSLQFKVTYDMVHEIGKNITYENFMFFARSGMIHNKFKFMRWLSYEMVILLSVSYSCLFVAISNIVNGAEEKNLKEKLLINLKYIAIPVLCMPAFFLETGRENFFNIFLFSLVTSAIMIQKKKGFSLQGKYAVLRVVSAIFVLFITIFLFFGFIRCRFTISDPMRTFILYIGSSIPGLSYFIDTHVFLENQYIGGNTLSGIYSNLTRLGFTLPKPVIFLETSYIHESFGTNVYTMLRRYIVDYGYVGTHLIMAILGIIYTAFYNYVRFYAKPFWHVILYGCFVSPLFLSMYDERFLMFIVNTSTVYKAAVIYLICRLFIQRVELARCSEMNSE